MIANTEPNEENKNDTYNNVPNTVVPQPTIIQNQEFNLMGDVLTKAISNILSNNNNLSPNAGTTTTHYLR